MKIELRNIEIYHELTKENIAFSADLHIENSRVGRASNSGSDGRTIYVINVSGHNLVEKAKEYLKKLPPLVYEDKSTFKYPITLERNLENVIDNLVFEHLSRALFNARLAKLLPNCIVFGSTEKPLRFVELKFPIKDILKLSNGIKILEKVIKEKVLPKMVKDDRILNTNIPPQLVALSNSIESKENKSVKQKINVNRRKSR